MRDSTICQKCTSECTVQSQDVFSIKKLFLCRHVHSSKLAKPVPPASDHLGNGLERVVGGEGKSPKKLNSPGDLSFSLSPMMYISPEGASSSTSEEEEEEDAHQHTETGRKEGKEGQYLFYTGRQNAEEATVSGQAGGVRWKTLSPPLFSFFPRPDPGIVSNFAVPSTQKKPALPPPPSRWVGGVLWFDHRNFGAASLACVTRSKKRRRLDLWESTESLSLPSLPSLSNISSLIGFLLFAPFPFDQRTEIRSINFKNV